MDRKQAIICLCAVAACACLGTHRAGAGTRASDKYRPRWLQQVPGRTNDTFEYIRAEGMSDDLQAAKAKAVANLVDRVAVEWNVQVSDAVDIDKDTERGMGNAITGHESRTRTSTHIRQESGSITLQYRLVDSYWEETAVGGERQYRFYGLYQAARPGQRTRFDDVSFTTRYGARGLWRSAIVPGWGQMHKGSTGRGWLFLGGEAACIGGIIATESMRSHYTRMASETRKLDLRNAYRTRARNMATARNVCIAGASALYVWNLVDAIVAPGARRATAAGRSLAVVPYSTAEDAGICLSFNF